MKTLLFLTLFAVVGCARSNTFYVSAEFSPAEQEHIQEAANYWATITHGAATFDLVFGANVSPCDTDRNVIVRLTRPNPCFGHSREPHNVGDEVQEPTTSRIMIRPDRMPAPSYFVVTMAHEFGHALDLDHVADPEGLMNSDPEEDCAGYLESGCLPLADAQEYCAHQDCTQSQPVVCQ